MTTMPLSRAMAAENAAARPAPPAPSRFVRTRQQLFASPGAGVVTVVAALALAAILWPAIRWALLDAVWYAPEGAAACAQPGAGACWAVIAEKYAVILFGNYPYDEQWRGMLIVGVWIFWALLSALRFVPVRIRLAGWALIFVGSILLMGGGVFGLTPVGTDKWGGLPLTFLIFGGTVAGGLPLAVALALGRRSRLPILAALCTGIIEFTRGVPLLVVLFFAALILPLFLPPELNVNKLVRAEIGMIVFFAAYAAEAIRGGLQSLPNGQDEAAKALGLSYVLRLRKVILPQAIAAALPSLFNDIVRAFKNTTFFSILGLFDVLGATKIALQDPEWIRYTTEGYLFIFALYFVFGSGLSLYGRALERAHLTRLRKAGK
ncbi:MAG: amino acid ABC transporter permease [Rhodobacteraceae bacterium]|nr:amino acid ABC transporter permease [Paracoccaceae bacterium]